MSIFINLFFNRNKFFLRILTLTLLFSFLNAENSSTIFIKSFLIKNNNYNQNSQKLNDNLNNFDFNKFRLGNPSNFKEFEKLNDAKNLKHSEKFEEFNNFEYFDFEYKNFLKKSFLKNYIDENEKTKNFVDSKNFGNQNFEKPEEIIYDENEKMTLKADRVSRDDMQKLVIADGNVITRYKDSVCYSDYLEYKDGEKFSKADGNVRLYEGDNYIKGQNIFYDLGSEMGEVINAKTFSDVWIITSEKLEKISKDKIIAYKSKITTCDYNHPHFYIKSKKVVVYLKNKFIAYQNIFYIRGIPIFYLPFWKQSLKKKKLRFTVRAGQSSTNGFYGKVKTTYIFDDNNNISLYTDEYEKRGFGLGLGGNYNFNKTKGNVYFYKIKDLIDMAEKKTATISHSQEINKNLKLYMNVNYQNDESFYKTYYYSGVSSQLEPTDSQVNSNIYSYSSLYYTRDFYYMNFLWEVENNWVLGKYEKAREVLPSFTFNTNKNKFFKTGLFYQYNFNIKNSFNSNTKDYYKEGETAFSLSKTKKITNRISLNPTIGIIENFNELAQNNKYSTSWNANLLLKSKINSDMDFYTTYVYNAGMFDKKSVRTNKLSFALSSYLLDGDFRITNATGYNLNQKDNSKELEKLDPFSTEIKYKINKFLNYYGRHSYNFQLKKTTFFQNIFYFFPSARLTFVENIAFLNSLPDSVDTISTIKLRPNLKWKIDYNYRFLYDYKKNICHSYSSQEIAILRDLHCFDLKFSYLTRAEAGNRYREFWITLRLKAMYDQDVSLYKNNRDYKKWYDWDFKNA